MVKGIQKNEEKHQHAKRGSRARTCQIAGCKYKYRAKGYCDKHYRMWRRGSFGRGYYRSCSAIDPKCTNAAVVSGNGLCADHLAELKKKRAAKVGVAAAAAPAAAPAASAPAAAAPAAAAPAAAAPPDEKAASADTPPADAPPAE